MSDPTERPTDYRARRRRDERRNVWLATLVLVVGGDVLVGLMYGLASAIGALPFLLAGAGAIWALYLAFVWMEKWANHEDE
jgi:hypothetical protein